MLGIDSYVRSLKGPILVTGASGFIGANLFLMLKKYRDDVYGLVRKQKNWRLAHIEDDFVIAVDLNDYSAVKNLISNLRPMTVFDCAAYGAYSFENETSLIYQTNFQSTINFVELLESVGISAFIHAGSSSEYGTNCAGPEETSICYPNSAYSVSKLAVSNYLYYKGKQQNFPCLTLRLYSVYGPLEDTSRLIPSLVRDALKGKLPELVDPDVSRDFVYVDDVCNAFILAAAKMQPELYGEFVNIGRGQKISILDLVEKTKEVFGLTIDPIFGTMKNRSWDLKNWYSNSQKARIILGWEPQTTIDDGLIKVSNWIKQLSDAESQELSKIHKKHERRGISAIVACYKDEKAIPIMYSRLKAVFTKLGVDYEIFFVNDCSPDNSGEVIRCLTADDSKVIGVNHSRNFGSQMAFRSGMELATKDAVVLLDGDLQDPPELIEDFYRKWHDGFDVVYGRRVKRDMPWYIGILYKLFYRIFAMFSYVKIPLDAGDFSLMDRRVVRWILSCEERDLFVRGLRAYVGFKQTGVDYFRPERMFGTSTNNFIKNIEWAKKGIFSFSNAPLTMLTSVGVASLFLSLFAAVLVGLLRIFMPDIAPKGVTTMLISILIFGSFNLFAIGLVGEYVAKIMVEVKGRPRLIRSALVRHGEVTELLPDGK